MDHEKAQAQNISWTEKYRPGTLDELVGHNKPVQDIRAWAVSWSEGPIPKKKGLIIEGEPGVGKTTAAFALANEMGWEAIELNASDARNMESIRMLATRGALSRDITDDQGYGSGTSPKMKLIVLDEADNLFEKSASVDEGPDVGDRGGKRAIIELLKFTKHPVVLIVNDLYGLTSGSGAPLLGLCEKVKFRKIGGPSIAKRLRQICNWEGIMFDEEVISSLSDHAEGDLRSAISDLQMISAGKKRLEPKDVDVLGFRDTKDSIFTVLDKIYSAGTLKAAKTAINEVDEDVESLMLWMSENVLVSMSHPEDTDRAFSLLSRADIFLGRVNRRQNYRLWSYARDLMAALSIARMNPHKRTGRYNFPSYLRSMSRTKEARSRMKETASALGALTHCSMRTIKEDPIWRLGLLCERDREFAAHLLASASLGPEHLKTLTRGRLTDEEMNSIAEESEGIAANMVRPRNLEGGIESYEEAIEADDEGQEEAPPKKEESEKVRKGTSQANLMDF